MIQVNELRVGNLLKWKNNNSIIECSINIYLQKAFYDNIKRGDIIPIPLTEEILKKNFSTPKGSLYIASLCYDFSIKRMDLDNPVILGIYYNGIFTGIRIDSVHELQNCYFIVNNEELKINL
jgi:hypothetical protein